MSFQAVTDENYGPPMIEAFYWVMLDDDTGPYPAEWHDGAFWVVGCHAKVDYSDLAGFWPVPMQEPAKPDGGAT